MLNAKTILLGLTTSSGSNWQDKVEEIKEFNIKELALLPNFLNFEQRKKLYQLLQDTALEEIPVVHLRHDMEQNELDYLVNKYKSKIFCLQADELGFKLYEKLPKYQSLIYLENPSNEKTAKYFNQAIFNEQQISGFCLDLTRLESQRYTNHSIFKHVTPGVEWIDKM